jgi:uncharacterized repeat protein (TIGR03803 family)
MRKLLFLTLLAGVSVVSGAEAATLTTLASFAFDSPEGRLPEGNLVIGNDGSLYGVAGGGASDRGTVFRWRPEGGLTTVVTFDGANGDSPARSLIRDAAGNMYGTTARGGAADYGTVFKLATDGTLTTLVDFNFINGWTPRTGVVLASDGSLYGSARDGGVGRLFRVTPGGSLSDVAFFDFGQSAASLPLIAGPDFYMTSFNGNGFGSVFRVSGTGTTQTLVSFDQSNGAFPQAELITDGQGNFFGTTSITGANGRGTVFRVTADGTLTTLVDFAGSNGAAPYGGLLMDAAGTLFGTTRNGGTDNVGTIFSLTRGGTLTTLVNFDRANGSRPFGTLVADSMGVLYGTTSTGGASGAGTIFKLEGAGFQVAGVPEPGHWTMLIAGFGLIGVQVRRRRAMAA